MPPIPLREAILGIDCHRKLIEDIDGQAELCRQYLTILQYMYVAIRRFGPELARGDCGHDRLGRESPLMSGDCFVSFHFLTVDREDSTQTKVTSRSTPTVLNITHISPTFTHC